MLCLGGGFGGGFDFWGRSIAEMAQPAGLRRRANHNKKMKTCILKFTRCLAARMCCALFGVVLAPAAFAQAQTNGPGSALDFGGGNGYVSVATTGSIAGTFTVELWANPNDPTNSLPLIGSRQPSDYGFEVRLHDANKIHVDIGNGNNWVAIGADATFPYTTGVWYHFACVVTPTGYTLYADGTQVAAATYPPDNPVLFDSQHDLSLGWSGIFSIRNTNDYMIGDLDEIRMWSTARSASQILTNMHRNLTGSETGLMGYWRCDDFTPAETTSDSSGHGIAGILLGSVFRDVSTAPIGIPVAATIPATTTNGFTVTLNGSVTPNYQEGGAWFQYGPTTNYGSTTPIIGISASDPAPEAVSDLINLSSVGIPWHFRMVASNSVGVGFGADAAFNVDFTNVVAGLTGVAAGSVLKESDESSRKMHDRTLWDGWDGSWDGLGRTLGRIKCAKSSMFTGLGTVGRINWGGEKV
jgi:hypothetical protein